MLQDRVELCELKNQDFEMRIAQMTKHTSENTATQATMPSTLKDNTELKEMEKRLIDLINQQGEDIAIDFQQFQNEISSQSKGTRQHIEIGEFGKRFSYEMLQLEQKMTAMIKQLDKKPNKSLPHDEKNIKATELRLEAKINFAIERVNEVILFLV